MNINENENSHLPFIMPNKRPTMGFYNRQKRSVIEVPSSNPSRQLIMPNTVMPYMVNRASQNDSILE
jgi:hypothetical protein